MRLKKVRLIITPALILFCITVVGLFFLKTVVQRPAVQRYLIESLSRSFGYDLRIDKVNMSLWKGIGVRAQALEATSRSGPERHITASSVAITFNTWQLIRGRIVPTKIFLLRPHIAISLVNEPESSKTKNEITDIKEIIHKSLSRLDSVLMQEARIHIKEHPFQIEGLHMSVRKLSHTSRKLHMDIQGKLESKDEVIPFSLDGSISLKKRTQKDISVDLMLQTKDVPLPSFLTHSPLPVKEGTAEAELKIKGMLDGPLAVEGKISTQNLRFLFAKRDILKEYILPQLLIHMEAVYSPKAIEIPTLRIHGPDFLVNANSTFDLHDPSNPSLDLKAWTPFMPIQALKSIFPDPYLPNWMHRRLLPILIEGDVSVKNFQLKGTLNQIDNVHLPENARCLSMRMVWKDLNILKENRKPARRGLSGEMSIENGVLQLSKINGGFGRSTVQEAAIRIGSVLKNATPYDISLDGRFYLDDILRQRKLDLIPKAIRQKLHDVESASGTLDARIAFHHEQGWKFGRTAEHSSGSLRFQNCLIKHNAFSLPIALTDANLEISKKGTEKIKFKGLLGNNPIHIKGNLKGWNGLKGNIDITSEDMCLSDIFEHLNGFNAIKKPSEPNRFMRQSDLGLTLKISKGRWKQLTYRPLEVKGRFRSGNLYIDSAKAQLEHGTIMSKGHLINGKRPERLLSMHIKLQQQPLRELLYSLGLEKAFVEGKLSTEMVLYAKGSNNGDLISNLNGTGSVLMERGKIMESRVIFKVLDFLSLKNIFKKRPSNLSKGGFYFDTITSNFSITNGILQTDNLVMKSPVFNAAAMGKMNFPNEWSDFIMATQPFGTIDSLVNMIPIVGRVVTNGENGFLVYYFRIKGSLQGPEVKYTQTKNINKNVYEMLNELLKTAKRSEKK